MRWRKTAAAAERAVKAAQGLAVARQQASTPTPIGTHPRLPTKRHANPLGLFTKELGGSHAEDELDVSAIEQKKGVDNEVMTHQTRTSDARPDT